MGGLEGTQCRADSANPKGKGMLGGQWDGVQGCGEKGQATVMVSRREGARKNGFWVLEVLTICSRGMGGGIAGTKEKGKERKEN